MTSPHMLRARRRTALVLFAGLFALYNANGREIGTMDTQPAKFTAREIAVRGALVLDRVVADQPRLADRPSLAGDRQGHVRSAYPLIPALIAAVPATLFQVSGLVDMDAPLAANLVAKLTASSLTASAVVLVFLALCAIVPQRAALATAAGLSLGTNFWIHLSQTLWAHETVAFGLALALWAWMRPPADTRWRHGALGGVGLMLAGAARPQVAPLVVSLLVWVAARNGARRAVLPAVIVGIAGLVNVTANLHWFGHPLGALPRLEALHPEIHATGGSAGNPVIGALGLLVSPSRGLLIFSPVVLVAAAGIRAAWRDRNWGLRWLLAGAAAQFVLYACYSVWWGGHTYGPRYALDLLVLLTPAGALGAASLAGHRIRLRAASALLAWSVAVSVAGVVVYPNEEWNTRPASVDRHHERLWQVRDSQIARVLQSSPSPHNFRLLNRTAVRRPPE